jgi:multiple sugar transport system ATP-binding protein
MSDVSIKKLRKAYGALDVIHSIDVEISEGEFVVLVGPSGCGKSTMLRMIAGLEKINSGTVAIGDRIVNDVAPKDRNIAMVFQNYALYPQMTVAQNMGFSLELAGNSKSEIKAKVDNVARILHLEDYLHRKPANLSGGQRQRVAIGRAMVREPKVFLFDEPLSNLDAKLRVQMRAEIKSLHNRLRNTIIYVTHDQVEAMTMADKIVVLNGGRVEQVGSPLELYDRPANVFVAGFLGSPAMNFYSARIKDGKATLSNGEVLSSDNGRRFEEGRALLLGVRPESFVISADGPLFATVNLIEPTGSETIISADLGSELTTILSRERLTVPLGGKIGLSVPEDKIHYFDAKTQLAI